PRPPLPVHQPIPAGQVAGVPPPAPGPEPAGSPAPDHALSGSSPVDPAPGPLGLRGDQAAVGDEGPGAVVRAPVRGQPGAALVRGRRTAPVPGRSGRLGPRPAPGPAAAPARAAPPGRPGTTFRPAGPGAAGWT